MVDSVGPYCQVRVLSQLAVSFLIRRYFDMPFDEPKNPNSALSVPPAEVVSSQSAAEWFAGIEAKLPEICDKSGIDRKSFDYATWDFLDFATSRTWKDVASKEKLAQTGFHEDLEVWTGWKHVLDELQKMDIIPKQ